MRKICLALLLIVVGLFVYNLIRWNMVSGGRSTNPYQVSLSALPKEVKPGQVFTISWSVSSPQPTQSKNTAIYFSSVSTPSAVTQMDTPAALGYTNMTPDFAGGDFSIPGDFSARIQAPQKGKIYLRGFAYIDGRNVWTDEQTIEVK